MNFQIQRQFKVKDILEKIPFNTKNQLLKWVPKSEQIPYPTCESNLACWSIMEHLHLVRCFPAANSNLTSKFLPFCKICIDMGDSQSAMLLWLWRLTPIHYCWLVLGDTPTVGWFNPQIWVVSRFGTQFRLLVGKLIFTIEVAWTQTDGVCPCCLLVICQSLML